MREERLLGKNATFKHLAINKPTTLDEEYSPVV
jgi:hypothetical protein